MNRQTLENILYEMIKFRFLNDDAYVSEEDVLNYFEIYCDNSEDLDEILNILINTKYLNYVSIKDSVSYFVDIDALSWEIFFEHINIPEDDEVWTKYFYNYGVSKPLRDIFEEVME